LTASFSNGFSVLAFSTASSILRRATSERFMTFAALWPTNPLSAAPRFFLSPASDHLW
jgi:hypothetical protein